MTNKTSKQFVTDWKKLPVGATFRLEPVGKPGIPGSQKTDDVLRKLEHGDAVSVKYPDQFYPMGLYSSDYRIVEVK